jgi:hypothetical protein
MLSVAMPVYGPRTTKATTRIYYYCYVAQGAKALTLALALALAFALLTKTENRANVNAPYDAFTLTHTTAES